MILEARGVAAGYNGRNIVSDVSFSLASGEVLCLLGPNGVGKTTLFKALLGFIPFTHGGLYMDGERVNHSDRRRLASFIGYVPQVHEPPFPFSVLDIVVMGSVARESLFGGPSRKAYREAEATLERLGVSYLRDKVYTEVSGGERQMVLIARPHAEACLPHDGRAYLESRLRQPDARAQPGQEPLRGGCGRHHDLAFYRPCLSCLFKGGCHVAHGAVSCGCGR